MKSFFEFSEAMKVERVDTGLPYGTYKTIVADAQGIKIKFMGGFPPMPILDAKPIPKPDHLQNVKGVALKIDTGGESYMTIMPIDHWTVLKDRLDATYASHGERAKQSLATQQSMAQASPLAAAAKPIGF